MARDNKTANQYSQRVEYAHRLVCGSSIEHPVKHSIGHLTKPSNVGDTNGRIPGLRQSDGQELFHRSRLPKTTSALASAAQVSSVAL